MESSMSHQCKVPRSTTNFRSQTGWLVDYAYNPTPPETFGWSETALDLGFVSPAALADPDIICHLGAKNGALSATVAAGTTMEVFWSGWPDSHKGPVIDYLASCKGDCATVDKTTLEYVPSKHFRLKLY